MIRTVWLALFCLISLAVIAGAKFISAPAGMTALTLWVVEGPDLKLRFAVVWVTAALDANQV